MFNRRLILLILALGFALGLLIWEWDTPPEIPLQSSSGPVSLGRWEMDITGQWVMYSSLRQAWITETEQQMVADSTHRITGGVLGYLPSSAGFHVAAKTFRVPAEWNARTLVLQLNGVEGQLSAYLNGMESINRIGTVESEAGGERLEIPINALRHGADNLLLFEMKAPPSQEKTLFGTQFPVKGQISGSITLQAVMETSLENPQLQVLWENDTAKVQLDVRLNHHGFSEYGPWTVHGVLSDGSAEVAQATVQIKPDENPVQALSMTFNIPNGRKWSTEDPYLYQLYLTVTNPKGDKDDLAFPVALSSLRFEEGVFLQKGKAHLIKGLAIQPDTEHRVRAAGEINTRLKDYKSKGYNLLYFIGNYPDELWLQEADKIGMGIWAELPGSAMVPIKRLNEPRVWGNLIQSGTLHPSLWAYTAGKGLESNSRVALQAYEKEINKIAYPIPTFNVRLTEQLAFQPEYSPLYTDRKIQGAWGEVGLTEETLEESAERWPQERWTSGLWAILVLIVAWANLAAVNWRYKELYTKKPKRALRRAWFWQGLALLSREITLAGVLTSFLLSAEVPWAPMIPNQWPLWDMIQLQSPWLIWALLGSLFTLGRLLQVGVAAPHMPGSPAPMGLALWLERRNAWNWIVALLWLLQPWGIPRYIPILVYIVLSIIFLPLKIRDVRRVGGRFSYFLLVPGFIVTTVCIMLLFRWEDGLFLWRLIQAY